MVIGILTVRDFNFHPNRRLREAATDQGHRISLIHPEICRFGIRIGQLSVESSCRGDAPEVLLPRIGANLSDYSLALIRQFERLSIPVVNRFDAILLARNKFLGLQTLAAQGIAVPDTYYVRDLKGFETAVGRLGGYPVVAKTLKSRQGAGIILIESDATAGFVTHNLLNNREGLVIQEYLDPSERTDLRVLVLGTTVVAAMELKPREGDFRSNIHLEGHGRSVVLDKGLEGLAVRCTAVLGLEISGTDIILTKGGPKIVEVNYSPGFRGLEAVTGLDIASRMIEYVTGKEREAS